MKRKSISKFWMMFGVAILTFFTDSKSTFASITLNNPTSSTSNRTLLIDYSLSESPNASSVIMVFSNVSVTRTIHLNNSTSASFTIDPTQDLAATYSSHITSVTEATSIPDGTYSVSMSYQNGGGTVTSATKTSVLIKTSTNAATLIAPTSFGAYTNSVPIQF